MNMNVVTYTEKESPTSTTSPSICSSRPSSSPSRSSNDDLSPMKTEWNFSLKGKLRQVIHEKRALTGSGEGESELDSPREEKFLNPDELMHISRQERIRKERNRLAAQRMRDRRKRYHETLVAELGGLETNNNSLESEIAELDRERERLEFTLLNHLSCCKLMPPSVDVNKNHLTDNECWTPAHNVAYLLSTNNIQNNNTVDTISLHNNRMNDSTANNTVVQNSAYAMNDNAAPRWESDAVSSDNSASTSQSSDNDVCLTDCSVAPQNVTTHKPVSVEQPLDLSTSPKKPSDLPVDLRVPRGIKHKLYIQQSEHSHDTGGTALKHSPDKHRQYHKKLRLFPSGHL